MWTLKQLADRYLSGMERTERRTASDAIVALGRWMAYYVGKMRSPRL